jgi:hypothetical protein
MYQWRILVWYSIHSSLDLVPGLRLHLMASWFFSLSIGNITSAWWLGLDHEMRIWWTSLIGRLIIKNSTKVQVTSPAGDSCLNVRLHHVLCTLWTGVQDHQVSYSFWCWWRVSLGCHFSVKLDLRLNNDVEWPYINGLRPWRSYCQCRFDGVLVSDQIYEDMAWAASGCTCRTDVSHHYLQL